MRTSRDRAIHASWHPLQRGPSVLLALISVVLDEALHVAASHGLGCYAGVPLISSRGFVLGNLCVVGLEERQFTELEIDALRYLAALAVQQIEARRVHPPATIAIT